MDPQEPADRIIPALPDMDSELGEIRWGNWAEALRISHIPGDCPTCLFPGPLRKIQGKTLYSPGSSWERVARPAQTRNGRSKWAKVQRKPYWVYSHWASRCPACDEVTAWRRSGSTGVEEWVEIYYHPSATRLF